LGPTETGKRQRKSAASFLLWLGNAMKEFEIRLTRKQPEDFVVSNQGVAPS
jgi:hypothetical protein